MNRGTAAALVMRDWAECVAEVIDAKNAALRAVIAAQGRQITGLEQRLAAVERELASHPAACEARSHREPLRLTTYQLQTIPLPDVVLDDVERRLADGIEPGVIAEMLDIPATTLDRQLRDRADSPRGAKVAECLRGVSS